MKLTNDQLKIRARAGIGQGMSVTQFVWCHPKSLHARARKAYLEACSEGAVDNISAALNNLGGGSYNPKLESDRPAGELPTTLPPPAKRKANPQ